MKLISILKGMISQIYIHINDLKPIMPFKINQDVYENYQSGQVSVVVFFFHSHGYWWKTVASVRTYVNHVMTYVNHVINICQYKIG